MNNNKERHTKDEVIVGNTTFKFELNQVSENVYDLVVTPCNVPTSVYCVARITVRENCCNNMEYYQAFINTDPVEIIQDCNLCDIVRRAIEVYFQNIGLFDGGNTYGNGCCNQRNFGLF